MDSTITELITVFSTAVAALFGALVLSLRQQREDWKGLFDQERAERKQALKEAADNTQENAQALRALADFIHELPRRREDWQRTSERRP